MSDSDNSGSSDVELRLAAVRGRIDSIDRKIQALLAERGQAALDVAEIKKGMSPGEAVNFYRPEREAQILRDVAKRNEGPLADTSVQRIFREIISASLALEGPMKVAYLGPEGTYSHAAAERHFGHAVTTMPEAGISEIFQAVEADRVRFGIVPVENSTEGTINHTLDRLMESPLRVCGEVRLRIQHQLLSQETSLDAVQAVHAHPQALAQCRNWLDAHLPGIKRISESSNAVAAQLASSTSGIAAIAGEQAGVRYQLQTLEAGIEDEKTNTTRFLVIGRQHIPPSGEDSTSLLVSAPHKPGGLRRLLQPLEDAGVSMTRIESRPGRTGLWEYVFFIDVAGHELDDTLKPVLEQLRDEAPLLRVLGSYPSALVETNTEV